MSTTIAGNLSVAHDTEEQSTEEIVSQLVTVVQEQQEQIDDLRDEIDDLRDEIHQERSERTRNDAEIRKRVTDVEESVEEGGSMDTEGRGCDDTDARPQPDTALEDLVTVPERILDDESANTQRAVFVTKDVRDYSTSVPAGRVITSSELRTILKAGTDCHGHTQTVTRVMDLLDDLGGGDVEIVDRRGTKRIVFTDAIVERLQELASGESHSCDGVKA